MTTKAHIRTPGELVNDLITVDIKLWFAMEDMANESKTHEQRFEAGQKAMSLNKLRNDLVEAIDVVLGFENYSNTPKTY